MKKNVTKIFIKETYSKAPMRKYLTNKTVYNHIDERWSIDLADMIDYKISNIRVFRYIFVIFDNLSKNLWCVPLKNKNSQTITKTFSNILTSKRSPLKLETDRRKEWYNSIFQNFLKLKNIQHYSRFTDKGHSLAERVIRTIRNLLKKQVFKKGNADWISEHPSVIKKYIDAIYNSKKWPSIKLARKFLKN